MPADVNGCESVELVESNRIQAAQAVRQHRNPGPNRYEGAAMENRTCTVDDCENKSIARGWCGNHWKKWKRYGSPTGSSTDYTCSVDGCDRGVYSLKTMLCRSHRKIQMRYGRTSPTWSQASDYLMSYVEQRGECWQWNGPTNGRYGMLYLPSWTGRHGVYAHRASYELFVADIPDVLEIDHLCRNTLCVNPEHLEPVTPRVNKLRALSAIQNTADA